MENSRSQSSPEWLHEYPWTSLMVVFGVGLGLGVVLGQTVSDSVWQRMGSTGAGTERLARQVRDAFKGALPEAVTRHFNS